jgi:large subunit ribosomal protein L24
VTLARIKKNDTVTAVAGVDTGKTGKVLAVDRVKGRAFVEGLNVVKKTLRKSQDHPQGGIAEKEAPLALARLMLYCPACKRGVRMRRVREGERDLRKCKACGHSFDG